jgi:hypothetical protein
MPSRSQKTLYLGRIRKKHFRPAGRRARCEIRPIRDRPTPRASPALARRGLLANQVMARCPRSRRNARFRVRDYRRHLQILAERAFDSYGPVVETRFLNSAGKT